MKKSFKQQIEDTLSSLDDLQPARTDPFFYSRLKARLENHTQTIGLKWSGPWRWGIAAMVLMLFLNVLSVYSNWPSNENPTITDDNYLDTLVEEYNIEATSIYEEIE